MVRHTGNTTAPRAKEERPVMGVLERYRKEKQHFIASFLSMCHQPGEKATVVNEGGPLLFHLARDPDVAIRVLAYRAINSLVLRFESVWDIDTDVMVGLANEMDAVAQRMKASKEHHQDGDIELFNEICATVANLFNWKKFHDALDESVVHICMKSCAMCLDVDDEQLQSYVVGMLNIFVSCRESLVQSFDVETSASSILEKIENRPRLERNALRFFSHAIPGITSPTLISALFTHAHSRLVQCDASKDTELIVDTLNLIDSILALHADTCEFDEQSYSVLCSCAAMSRENASLVVALNILARLASNCSEAIVYLFKHIDVLKGMAEFLDDLDGPQLLPVLYVVVHICKYSEEYCNVMIDEPFECIRRFAVVLAHGSQENVQQVAAWGLGVIGSQNAQFAQRVAESGGLLTIIAAMRGQRDENSPIFSTCQDSGCATVSKLEYLDALIALLDQDISEAIRVELFKRTADILQANPFYCADFVQAGALETLIAQGEKNPALHHSMMSICQMYPKELVNRCSPSYMKQLVDKFKRESMKSVGPTLPEESVDCTTDDNLVDDDGDGSASV
ncbi:hypothetical protein M9435_003990 [Picochlorum sp. BPE23]|nr:hypothetical protein M9435_003990 [Picochlorum sp. BPE23]